MHSCIKKKRRNKSKRLAYLSYYLSLLREVGVGESCEALEKIGVGSKLRARNDAQLFFSRRFFFFT